MRVLSDHMARKNQSYQDLANHLQSRVEDAATSVEDHAEKFARRMEEGLEDQLYEARDGVRKTADRRFEALHEVQIQFQELESTRDAARGKAFMAQSAESVEPLGTAPFALLALFGVAFACFAFIRNHKSQTVRMPEHLLG